MTERCKSNPCCGNYLNCKEPPQFKPHESYEDYRTRTATPALDALPSLDEAVPASGGVEGDLVSRAEVLRVLRRLGDQDADFALYGAEDNARAREYGEAAATRACCAIALMPAALASSTPAESKP